MTDFNRIKTWARRLKKEIHTLYLASQDSRTPWYAKLMAICVVAYALSPIDLIPDFIPILGYLDDVILLPLGIYLTLRLIPQEVIHECRQKVDAAPAWGKGARWLIGALVVAIWLLMAGWVISRFW